MPLAEPKEKKERRIGEKLFLKGTRSFSSKSAIARRPFPPGMHGKKFRRNKSEFGIQLKEKKKVQYLYNISDSALRAYFNAARADIKKPTAEGLAELLESRLDNVVFRSGLALSRSIARHLVSYGHIAVNDMRTRQPGFHVRPGHRIHVMESSKESPLFLGLDERWEKYTAPEWLTVDRKAKTATVSRMPHLGDIMTQQNMPLIVEYYSK